MRGCLTSKIIRTQRKLSELVLEKDRYASGTRLRNSLRLLRPNCSFIPAQEFSSASHQIHGIRAIVVARKNRRSSFGFSFGVLERVDLVEGERWRGR